MSSEVAISVRNLSKVYRIYERPEHRLIQMATLGRVRRYTEFAALRDVSFEVRRGETLGIIGRNGCGKSTLLQIVCGTLQPSAGTVAAHGRIAALLELGAGFNPEFTGRENVYMNGAILGFSREEMDARFEAIAAFAAIGDFIERPVKTYSSGMYARLAFAVAASVEPDILVVDEALSVGDEAFQRKCFGRIETLRERGATILFVSHSAGTVLELCDRAMLLDAGERLATGSPKAIVTAYQRLVYASGDEMRGIRDEIRAAAAASGGELKLPDVLAGVVAAAPANSGQAADNAAGADDELACGPVFDPEFRSLSIVEYGSKDAKIDHPHLRDGKGREVNILRSGKEYDYTYEVSFENPAFGVRFGMLLKTVSGLELGGYVSAPAGRGIPFVAAGARFRVCFPLRIALAPGVYFLNAGLVGQVNGEETYLHRLIDAVIFRVEALPGSRTSAYVDFSVSPHVQVAAIPSGPEPPEWNAVAVEHALAARELLERKAEQQVS